MLDYGNVQVEKSFRHSLSYLSCAALATIAVKLVNNDGVESLLKLDMLKVDIPCITRTPLRNKWRSFKRKRKRYWMRYNIVIVKDFYPSYMSRLFTGHVLILAPFWVWVKLQCSTYTYSTVSWPPFLPKLPTLNEIFILV